MIFPDKTFSPKRTPVMPPAPGRAFTLIEAIAAIIILSIVASLVVPRFVGSDARQAENEAAALQRLLSIAAEKYALSAQPVGIEYTAEPPRLALRTFRPRGSASPGTDAPAEWRADPLVEPVALVRTQVKQAFAGGRALDQRRWFVVFSPGQARPDLLITLARVSDSERTTVVALPQTAIAANRSDAGGAQRAAAGPQAVDLDDAGRGTSPW